MKEKPVEISIDQISFDGICHVLFESAAEGLAVVNTKGQILMANERLGEMFGYEPNELEGKQIDILVPRKYAENHHHHRERYNEAPTRRIMGTGRDLSGRRKDDSEFPVEIALNHFETGEQRYIIALVSDITQRKTAELELARLNQDLEERVQSRTNELKESQNIYSVIARNFPNGTINVFDNKFDYVFAEGRELFRMGVTSEELVGTNYLSRLDETVREEVRSSLESVFEGQHLTFDLEVSEKFYELHAVPLTDTIGQINQILVVENNVTQQKKAEMNVLQTLEKEMKLNELKSRFVSMASHEFRTPLSTVLSSLSLLEKYDQMGQAENKPKHFSRIRSSVRHLTNLLNDFLSLEKVEAGKINVTIEEIDIKGLLEEIVDQHRQMTKPGQSILFEYFGPTEIYTDRNLVQIMCANLLSNAIKYSKEGSVVELQAKMTVNQIVIEVKDSGIGIPYQDQENMFGSFFRASNASNIEGTGLGLNIVSKHLQLLKGNIIFDSVPDEGSIFTITIPNAFHHEKNSIDRG